MTINYSMFHQAQLILDFTTAFLDSASRVQSAELSDEIDAVVKATLKKFPKVQIDNLYKRYGLDLGLASHDQESIIAAANEIMAWVKNHDNLR